MEFVIFYYWNRLSWSSKYARFWYGVHLFWFVHDLSLSWYVGTVICILRKPFGRLSIAGMLVGGCFHRRPSLTILQDRLNGFGFGYIHLTSLTICVNRRLLSLGSCNGCGSQIQSFDLFILIIFLSFGVYLNILSLNISISYGLLFWPYFRRHSGSIATARGVYSHRMSLSNTAGLDPWVAISMTLRQQEKRERDYTLL